MTNSSRKIWVDNARGIGILIIFMIHSVPSAVRADSMIARNIYDIGMFIGRQLFFLLAGYTFQLTLQKKNKLSNWEYSISKFKKLMIPYLVYGLMIILIFSVCFYIPGLSSLVEKTNYGKITIGKALNGILIGDVPYALHLWFLYDLFIFSIVTFALKKIGKYSDIIIIILAVLLWKVMSVRNWENCTAIVNVMYFYIWFVLGSVLPIEKMKKSCFISGLLLWILYWGMSEGIRNENVSSIWIGDLYSNITLSGGFIAILIGISKYMKSFISKGLQYIGRKSFDMYIFQQPFLGSVLGTVFYKILHFSAIWTIVVTFVVSIIGTLFISYILEKTVYLKKLFGR